MKVRLKNLDNVNINSESQVFVDIKRGRQEVENVRQLKQNLTSASAGKAMPDFVMRNVDYLLNKVRCLGQFVKKKAFKAALYGEYDVRMSGDENKCNITGSCELSDGSILIADYFNNCIKKLNKSHRITERLYMPSHPGGICQAGDGEVAVTLTIERKVQFVNVRGKLKLTGSFKVSEICRGIICSKGELFVSCGGYQGSKHIATEGPGFVGVYNMAGSLLRQIQLDHDGQQIVSMPLHITATDNGNKFDIADEDGRVVTVDRQGDVLSTFFDGLQNTSGVCAVTDDNLLVCGYGSNNIIQISTGGEMVAQLLGEEKGITMAYSLLFLRRGSRLIVTEEESDKIKVFRLSLS